MHCLRGLDSRQRKVDVGLIRKNVQEMTAYVPGEQPAVPGLLKLNTNENPYPPSPRVAEALERVNVVDLRRYPDPGCRELRKAVGLLHGVAPECVFAGNGSDEVLTLCVRAFVEDSGRIGYCNPSYSLYPVLAAAAGVAVAPVELDADFGWRMPVDYSADLFFLTRPNAPTGSVIPLAQVREFCGAFNGVVVVDEAYADFADDNGMQLAMDFENVLVCRTLSKSYSLAGLRVGYAVGSKKLIEALDKLKDSYNIGYIEQQLALAAIKDQDYMRRHAARIIETRERISRDLILKGFDVIPSQANFVWVKPSRLSAKDLFMALRNTGILVRYFPGPRTGDYLRITIGTDADMDRFMKEMNNVLNGGG